MLKLKLQYFGHMMWRANLPEKALMLGNIKGRRRREWQRMRWLDGMTDSMTWVGAISGRQWRTGKPGMLQSMGYKESDMTEWLNNNNKVTIRWQELVSTLKNLHRIRQGQPLPFLGGQEASFDSLFMVHLNFRKAKYMEEKIHIL